MRSDTRRNIARLMEAVGEEIEQNPGGVNMQSAAARAGISTATAYRYFSSVDELIAAYVIRIFDELRSFSHDCPLSGVELFDAVLARWIDLVLEHGKVMVQLRSRTGYLERWDAGEAVIQRSREIWERPVAALLQQIEQPESMLRQALFLANLLTDPREIIDLHQTEHLGAARIAEHLGDAVAGAITGWAENTLSRAYTRSINAS
ncbi:TetR/AcrR family transcriptional regulator [Leifsonia sp. 2MCAF36]|uniref:TetR/AcrR family transcriptional regulator n=1 Tax=Leifsonia sp. 2MCAF36 TaxID=3232988 RepID=UPI003F9C7C55